jgi:hypothetical protein
MPIITIIITLVVVGFLLWLLETYVPMDAVIKRLIYIVVIVCVVLWLLHAFGVWHYLTQIRA